MMRLILLISLISISIIGQSNSIDVIDWSNGNWAMNCDLPGNDISSAPTKGEDCYGKCRSTEGCTHFTWTNYYGGTCWMKTGRVCKSNAKYRPGAVCGIRKNVCGHGDDETHVGGGDLDGGDDSTLAYGDLLWSDEFNYTGSPDNDLWLQDTSITQNNELNHYTKNRNSKVRNGHLIIESKKEDYDRMKYTSGMIKSNNKFRYGIFEIRAKLPKGRGIRSAFWMLSANQPLNWPNDGEIDIMEHVGYDATRIHSTVQTGHFNHNFGTQDGKSFRLMNPFDDFNTYTLDWTPSYVKTYVNGEHFFTYKKRDASFGAWPFDTDFNIILNAAVGGNWGGKQGVDDNIFPTQYTIDYVRHYQNGFVQA